MTNGEMRSTAWKISFEEGWFGRMMVVELLLVSVYCMADSLLNALSETHGVVDFFDLAREVLSARVAQRPVTLPGGAEMLRMGVATAFNVAFAMLFLGCVRWGVSRTELASARRDCNGWIVRSFGGFREPLAVLSLMLQLTLRISLWSLLLVVPGIVAAYRYSQAFFFKCEHPDWTASRCIAESCRVMKGRKAALLSLHFSYWRALLTALVISALDSTVDWLPMRSVCMMVMFSIGIYVGVGNALFHRGLNLKAEDSHDVA